MTRIKRGCGYCLNENCPDYAKGVFLLEHGRGFHCPRCRESGHLEMEKGSYTGSSEYFSEVRVEYNFDPLNFKYREIAIVRDEEIQGGNTYILQSPLIRTERRGLKVAEAILSNLNRYRGILNGEIPPTRETILSWDDDRTAFAHQCQKLYKELKDSNLVRKE